MEEISLKWKTVTLILTEKCNLHCTYCYENHKSARTMSIDTAKKIIYDEMTRDDFSEGVNIDFFGGEPFLNFEIIKELVEYIKSSNFKKPYTVFATTNGTLVHGEVQNWLKSQKGIFTCGLSLDGTKRMHDVNRSNSFDNIDLDFFVKQYPYQLIKMTVSNETIGDLFDGVKFCHEKGFRVGCNLAFGIDWSNEDNVSILERELHKLIDYYLEHPEIEPCSMLNSNIDFVGYNQQEGTTRKWCGTGTHMHTYDVSGELYPCQFFTPLSAGTEKSRESRKLVFYNDIPFDLIDTKCKECVVKDICPTCYGSNYVSTGSLYSKDDNYCKLMKIQMRARSYFRAKQWLLGQMDLSQEEEQVLLRSIIAIQDDLKI